MALFMIVCVVGALIAVNTYLVDGVVGSGLRLIFGDDTVYATAYSEAAFRRIAIGMTEDQVRALLGEPLGMRVQPFGRTSWWFTTSPHDKSYRQRAVVFQDGLVTQILHEFYVD